MIRRVIFLFTSVVLLVSGELAAQTNGSTSVEQTDFSAEDEAVKNPVTIPDDVLAKLAQDSRINGAMEDAEPPLKQPPQSWFSASAIHLGASSEKDLIIEAEGPLLGANVVSYWIFRLLPQGAILVLDGPAHDLIVRRARWKGLREIELASATATKSHTVLLRFNGDQFITFFDKWKDIK